MAGLDELRLVRERHQRVAPVEENSAQHRGYASDVARKVLWASFALVPLTFLADYALHWGDVPLFVLAALALVPLAWLIGEATEHAAHHTGPGIGGFLNATFGNAPELIISMLAINQRAHRGRPRIADRKRRRQRAARARLLALLRPRRSVGRPRVELHLARPHPRRRRRVPRPCDPGLARRPGAPLARGALAPGLDRAARPVRRRHVVAAASATRESTRRRRAPKACGRSATSIAVLGVATVADRTDRGDPRRLDRDVRREGAPVRLLRRGRDRRDRRQRGRARRRGRRRLSREDQPGGRDRALVRAPRSRCSSSLR